MAKRIKVKESPQQLGCLLILQAVMASTQQQWSEKGQAGKCQQVVRQPRLIDIKGRL